MADIEQEYESGTLSASPSQRHPLSGTLSAAPSLKKIENNFTRILGRFIVRFPIWIDTVVLLSAVILKACWVSTDPFWETKTLISPLVFLSGISVELFCGILLLPPFASYRVVLGGVGSFHLVLLAISIWHLLNHQSCNCFGGYVSTPLSALIVYNLFYSTFYLSLFFVGELSRGRVSQVVPQKISSTSIGILGGLCLGLFLVLFSSHTMVGARLFNPGKSMIYAEEVSFRIPVGSKFHAGQLRIINHTNKTFRIVGVKASCDCVVLGNFSGSIVSPGAKNIDFSIDLANKKPGDVIRQEVLFYIDSPLQSSIRFKVSGQLY